MRFFVWVFSSKYPSWSHLRFPRAIFNFSEFSRSYVHFKNTIWRPGHRIVADCRCPRHRIVIVFQCPGHRIVVKNTHVDKLPGHRIVEVYRCPRHRIVVVCRWPGHWIVVFWVFAGFFKLQPLATAFRAIIYEKSVCLFYLL